MRLNVKEYDSYVVYLHNKNQMIATKLDDIFGQKDIQIQVSDQLRKSVGFGYYSKYYKIKRIHWKAKDRPEKKCSDQTTEATTSMCITRHIELAIGCSMGLSGSNPQIPV